jgi:hypothetical protein
MKRVTYLLTVMDPCFRSWNSIFLSLIIPWGTWWERKAILNSFQLMVSGSSWASIYASHQSVAGHVSWCEASSTLSWLLHWTIWCFFSTVLRQSSASMGSMEWEKGGGLMCWKPPSLSLDDGGDSWGWAFCMLTMVCCMVWSIWACIIKTCSRVSGGLAALLFSALLFSALALGSLCWPSEELIR